ncbi:hypothetical protein OU798_19835 [Prolixibacteraceae bacterium Z1-6]|uniref:Uncharacterized protein n=1 Tax=Draconibacterium aestuarii TaxID=2998507 RepID=A0A9X3J8I7_9BACT|nr:hypothetical protein [Prolixibacteraceae bacterium Z1-6]
MKNIYFFTFWASEIEFPAITFDEYSSLLTENFLLALILLFGFFFLAVIVYYSICFIVLYYTRFTGYSNVYEKQNISVEFTEKV